METAALDSNSFFVTQRWLGGMLTNWSTIKTCLDNLDYLCEFFFKFFINILLTFA